MLFLIHMYAGNIKKLTRNKNTSNTSMKNIMNMTVCKKELMEYLQMTERGNV